MSQDYEEKSREGPADVSGRRRSRVPYASECAPRLAEVLTHWKAQAPESDDDSKPVDTIAEQIFAASDRNCAAVMERDSGLPLVAMNDWSNVAVEGGGTGNHPVVFASGSYEHVPGTTAQLHAEMKLLAYCGEKHIPIGAHIGISKRCCLRCAVVMKICGHGAKHRGCSGGLWSAGWTIPPFVKSSTALLEAFLGEEVYKWYLSLGGDDLMTGNNNRADFLSKIQTLKD